MIRGADVGVYRAPMRSRRDDVDPYAAVERALTSGVCGMGAPTDERAERRLQRLARADPGSFVWTRDVDGLAYLGVLGDDLRCDDSPEARRVDLVWVRDCDWLPSPVPDGEVPPAVRHTFARGGRNFQQIHDARVGLESEHVWDRAR